MSENISLSHQSTEERLWRIDNVINETLGSNDYISEHWEDYLNSAKESLTKLRQSILEANNDAEKRRESYAVFSREINELNAPQKEEILSVVDWIKSDLSSLIEEISENSNWRAINENFLRNWVFDDIESKWRLSSFMEILENPSKLFEWLLFNFQWFWNSIKWLFKMSWQESYITWLDKNYFSKIWNFFEKFWMFANWEWEIFSDTALQIKDVSLDEFLWKIRWDDLVLDYNTFDGIWKINEDWTKSTITWLTGLDEEKTNEVLTKLEKFIKQNRSYISRTFSWDKIKWKTIWDLFSSLFNNDLIDSSRDYATPSIWVVAYINPNSLDGASII